MLQLPSNSSLLPHLYATASRNISPCFVLKVLLLYFSQRIFCIFLAKVCFELFDQVLCLRGQQKSKKLLRERFLYLRGNQSDAISLLLERKAKVLSSILEFQGPMGPSF